MFENIKKIAVPRQQNEEQRPLSVNFVGETVCDDKFDIKRECSDLMSLEYIVEGRGTLEINGQVLHPEKGDVFFLPYGSRHHYYSNSKNGWRKYFISFYGKMADALVENYLPKNTYLFKGCFLEKNFSRIFDLAFNTESLSDAEYLICIELLSSFRPCMKEKRWSSLILPIRSKEVLMIIYMMNLILTRFAVI